ncbi:MAG: hypothetical protein R3C45_21705 [Phycisphaerales bacterium]
MPGGGAGRFLILSDGLYTGRDPAVDARARAGCGIAIDYRDMSRTRAGDAAVMRVDAPDSVQPGEAFMITGWVHLPTPQTVTLELWRGEQRITTGQRELPAGLSRVTFRDRAGSPGSAGYRLTVSGAENDSVPENNTARFIVGVEGRCCRCWFPKPTARVWAPPAALGRSRCAHRHARPGRRIT